jgi:hypothetical protein
MYITSESNMRHTRFGKWMKVAAALAAALAGATGAHGETRFTSFTFENDFFAGYDRHYTNGVQAAFLTDLARAPQWLCSLSADPQAVIGVGQRIYTPTNTDAALPDPHDRPYAGWTYVMGDLRTRAGPTIDHVTVAAGVLGPASGARQSQNNIHHLIGDTPARGWDTQVRNGYTFMAGYERAWPNVLQGALGTHHWDLALRAGAMAGTPLTYANAGTVLRYGSNLPTDLPVTHISLGPPRDGFRGAPQFGWYVWAGLDAHAVAYNSFLEASTYSGGDHVERRNFGADTQVGVAAVWPRARVGFTMVQRSKEFAGQTGNDRYGQLAISFSY